MKLYRLLVLALVLCLLFWIVPAAAQTEAEEVCCSHNGMVEPCNPEYKNITPPICVTGVQMTQSKFLRKSTTNSHILLEEGQIMVEGSFYYKDFFGSPQPIRYAPVYIYEYNDLLSLPIAMTITDNNGNFLAGPFENRDSSLDNTTADIQVMATTLGNYFEVKTDDFGLGYFIYSNVSMNVPDGVVNLKTTMPVDGQNGAWAAYDALMSGWFYPYYNFNYSTPKIKLHWPDMNWLIFTVPHGAYYVHGGDIYVGLDAATSPDVITHEYSHFLMYSLYNNWLPATENCSTHEAYAKSSEKCAWVEGWANFYPTLIFNKTHIDYNGFWSIGIEDVEVGDEGDSVEGRVAGFLNDLVDANNEYYDNITASPANIWSIINSSHISNLSEFWTAWNNHGYDRRGGLGALYQNTIDYCMDAEGDGFKERPCGWDCNDLDSRVNPNVTEICNSIDDDCNGQVDEGFDVDLDGFTACGGDCNDKNAQTNPNASEICNGIDDDCNGIMDDICQKAACDSMVYNDVFMTDDLKCYRFSVGDFVDYYPGVTIAKSNVVFDCNGHSISNYLGGYTPPPYTGLYILGNVTNVTIRNCVINDFTENLRINGRGNRVEYLTSALGGGTARIHIFVSGEGNNISNAVTYGVGFPLVLNGNNTVVVDSSLGSRSSPTHINSSHNSIRNTMFLLYDSFYDRQDVVRIQNGASNNTFTNVSFRDSGSVLLRGCWNSFDAANMLNLFGRALIANNRQKCQNFVVESSINGSELDIDNQNGTLFALDVRYAKEGSAGVLARQWRFAVRVTDRNGSGMANANVTLYNRTGEFFASNLTDMLGFANFAATEYVNSSGMTSYYDPYNITVSKTGYSEFKIQMNTSGHSMLDVFIAPALMGDVNGDCVINIFDLAAVGLIFGSVAGGSGWNPAADINRDEIINIFDLAAVGLNYGTRC